MKESDRGEKTLYYNVAELHRSLTFHDGTIGTAIQVIFAFVIEDMVRRSPMMCAGDRMSPFVLRYRTLQLTAIAAFLVIECCNNPVRECKNMGS